MALRKQGLVFISCGQYREEEIALGGALAERVSEFTAFEGYFAQNQTSLDGLSQHIFRALSRASGFVAVMHHRGEVETLSGRHVRASVWIEQEIAIAAFLRQTMDRDLPVIVYIQKAIHREGVRDQLLLGAVEFETETEVLQDFTKRLKDGTFVTTPSAEPKNVELHIDFKTVRRQQDYHEYRLGVFVKNTGREPITKYWVDLQFPRAVLNSSTTYAAEVPDRRTHNQMFLRQTNEQTKRELYPGDEIVLLPIDYHVDHELYEAGQVMKEIVTVCFGAPGMPTVRVEKPFRDLQEF